MQRCKNKMASNKEKITAKVATKLKPQAIGIDLGTTYVCVAVRQNNQVEIIKNERGTRTFPSTVCFSDEDIKIGHEAKSRAHMYSENTVFELKRIIGRKFSDETTQDDVKFWPFKVIPKDDNPMVVVKENGKFKMYHPEEIISLILKNAKNIAEDFLDCPVTEAVITVPARFNNSQRKATIDSAEMAGFRVLQVINEPTAAAIAYGWESSKCETKKVLVYDLGGGTFDISIVLIEKGNYKVLTTTGDTHLGGKDFDNNLVDFLVDDFHDKHCVDLKKSKYAVARLRAKCEEVKETLSFQKKTSVEMECIHKEKSIHTIIKRQQFEEINNHLFKRTIELVQSCLKDAGLAKEDIDDVILVGGSTRIPKIKEMLQEFFEGKPLMQTVNPDEAVAHGAAIQAALLQENESGVLTLNSSVKVSDVTSLSLGTAVGLRRQMCVLISRNTEMPCSVSREFCTIYDDQKAVTCDIYEGEHELAEDNKFLGQFKIDNLPKRRARELSFLCTFSIDANGILNVQTTVQGTELKGGITIGLTECRVSPVEVQRLVEEAKRKAVQDARQFKLNEAKKELIHFCSATKAKVAENPDGVGKLKNVVVVRACDEALNKVKQMNDAYQVNGLTHEIKSAFQLLLD